LPAGQPQFFERLADVDAGAAADVDELLEPVLAARTSKAARRAVRYVLDGSRSRAGSRRLGLGFAALIHRRYYGGKKGSPHIRAQRDAGAAQNADH
jgi:hypothetical protein